ncbi:MAG: AAA family ATPase, partial [Gloeobacteraceae cyanobacterium ES-bin-144]|nr:AAA family ATPase [Verrucomicrobiales bacterium]
NIIVDYPSESEEREIIRRVTSPSDTTVTPLLNAEEIMKIQAIVKRVPVGDHVIDFAAKLARSTRPKDASAPDFVKEMVSWGAGPRAGISLISAAKAHAILRGRYHATTGDVAAVAAPVLRHRVLTTFNAEAAGITSDDVIVRLIKHIAPKEEFVL